MIERLKTIARRFARALELHAAGLGWIDAIRFARIPAIAGGSNALTSQGCKIQREVASGSGTYEDIGEVVDFEGPGGESPRIDVTHLASTLREYKLALPDPGTFTFNCSRVPTDAVQNKVYAQWRARTEWRYRLTLSDLTTTFTFLALVSNFRHSAAKDDIVKAAVSLQITGDIT